MDQEKAAYERFKLKWMLDHGYTLSDLIEQLQKMKDEADPDMSLQSIFEDWEFGFGFNSEIWPSFDEYVKNDGRLSV